MIVEFGTSATSVSSVVVVSEPATLVSPGWSAASTDGSNAADSPLGSGIDDFVPVVANLSARSGIVTFIVTTWIRFRSASGSVASVVAGGVAAPSSRCTATVPAARCWTTCVSS